jgi:hypothetical protein
MEGGVCGGGADTPTLRIENVIETTIRVTNKMERLSFLIFKPQFLGILLSL